MVRGKPINRKTIEAMRRQRAKGATYKKISDDFGICISAVFRHCKGIRVKRRGRRRRRRVVRKKKGWKFW